MTLNEMHMLSIRVVRSGLCCSYVLGWYPKTIDRPLIEHIIAHDKTNKMVCARSEDSDQRLGFRQSDQSLCCALIG